MEFLGTEAGSKRAQEQVHLKSTHRVWGDEKKRLKTFLRPQVRQAFANSESRAGGKESGKMQSDVEMTPMKSGRAR